MIYEFCNTWPALQNYSLSNMSVIFKSCVTWIVCCIGQCMTQYSNACAHTHTQWHTDSHVKDLHVYYSSIEWSIKKGRSSELKCCSDWP